MERKADLKILIVDDSSSMRLIIKKMLNDTNFTNLFEASDGIAALSMILDAHKEGRPFELILSDWNMPVMQGIDLLKTIRQDKDLAQLPFIMITMEGDSEFLELAVKTGVTDFLLKPFDAPMFEEKLNKLFS